MIYTPGTIANSFLERARISGRQITPMQLQKLMYFAQGWWLTYGNDPLIDEPFEAWEHGPVCASVYHEFKHLGSRLIDKHAHMFEVKCDNATDDFEVAIAKPVGKDDTLVTGLLDFIWEKYGGFSGVELSTMTHTNKPGNPWSETLKKAGTQKIKRGLSIPNDMIQRYFNDLATNKEFY